MTGDILLVLGLLLATILLFASDRLRMDFVAILVLLALMMSGLLAPKEALAGFGDPLVVLIAGLFVIGEGLFRTGVAFAIGNWLLGVAGNSETRLFVLLMLVVAGLSAFMSSCRLHSRRTEPEHQGERARQSPANAYGILWISRRHVDLDRHPAKSGRQQSAFQGGHDALYSLVAK